MVKDTKIQKYFFSQMQKGERCIKFNDDNGRTYLTNGFAAYLEINKFLNLDKWQTIKCPWDSNIKKSDLIEVKLSNKQLSLNKGIVIIFEYEDIEIAVNKKFFDLIETDGRTNLEFFIQTKSSIHPVYVYENDLLIALLLPIKMKD